ncbi:uncharacterized protein [Argopecten irradians]|uniref:uncharacterized protein n=1 Tax=Argopecten irradians TaxID=31199 RepID=UPI0037158179
MDADEISLLQDYKSYFENNVDPITIVNALRMRGHVDASSVKHVYDIYRNSFEDRMAVWKEVTKCISIKCSFPSFLSVLDTTGYTNLSLELSVHIRSIKGRLNDVVRLQRGNCRGANHKFAQELFVSLKINTHNNTFKNPRENLHELSQRFRVRFLSEVDSEKKMVIADKYAASLCAEIDSHTMLYVRKFPTHNLFKELEDLIPETSNTHVTEVAYKSRMAIACAIADDMERGEEFLTDARVASYHIGPCVQLDNMLYIQVFNYLCKFESNPTDDLRDTIINLAGVSLQALEDEDDVTRLFWKRMFLLRMVYCLLGISNRCDLIPRCVTRQKYVTRARQLMAEIDKIWDGIESRRRMFYHVARARLHEIDSNCCLKQGLSEMARKRSVEEAMMNIEAAIFRIETAITLGEEGNFGETKYVKLYASELQERKFQLVLQQTGRPGREGHEHMDNSKIFLPSEQESPNHKRVAAGACENADLTSYHSHSYQPQCNSDDEIPDKNKRTECDKSAICNNATSVNQHNRTGNQRQRHNGNSNHEILVSQQMKFRPSGVQYQPSENVRFPHPTENIKRESCHLSTQQISFRNEFRVDTRETCGFQPQSGACRHIDRQVNTEDLRQPESATYRHIDIQVDTEDLRQPESATCRHIDRQVDTEDLRQPESAKCQHLGRQIKTENLCLPQSISYQDFKELQSPQVRSNTCQQSPHCICRPENTLLGQVPSSKESTLLTNQKGHQDGTQNKQPTVQATVKGNNHGCYQPEGDEHQQTVHPPENMNSTYQHANPQDIDHNYVSLCQATVGQPESDDNPYISYGFHTTTQKPTNQTTPNDL